MPKLPQAPLTALLLFLPLAACFLPACNIVGPAVVLIHGPEKTAAQHELDPKRTTVFFVDDRGNRLDRRALRRTIAVTAQTVLMKEGVLDEKKVVDAAATLMLVSNEPAGEPMDIVTLGKSIGAEVVVYITVDRFMLSADSATFQPTATLRVKVIDCINTPARIWPEEPEGKAVVVTMPQRQGQAPRNASDAMRAQDRLAEECGRSVAELFFRHVTGRRISEINERN
jgi:hypothetical protein